MTLQEYIQGKIQVIEKEINKTEAFLSSENAVKHRNYRKSAERRLLQLKNKLIEFESGNLTEESIYNYENLYKNQDYNIDRISAL